MQLKFMVVRFFLLLSLSLKWKRRHEEFTKSCFRFLFLGVLGGVWFPVTLQAGQGHVGTCDYVLPINKCQEGMGSTCSPWCDFGIIFELQKS